MTAVLFTPAMQAFGNKTDHPIPTIMACTLLWSGTYGDIVSAAFSYEDLTGYAGIMLSPGIPARIENKQGTGALVLISEGCMSCDDN